MDKLPVMTMTSLKKFRNNNGLKGLVQIHHVIPKSCFTLNSSMFDFKVNNPSNLLLMPSKKHFYGAHFIHNGPHKKYTEFVKEEIKYIQRELLLTSFVFFLRDKLTENDQSIPWN